MSLATAPVYNDFHGLSALRAKANSTPQEAVGEVATHFESLFMQMMLKSMRDATIEGGLFDSNQMEMYQQMFDQQVSLDLSAQGGLGLSGTLMTQLGGDQALVENPEDPQPLVSFRDTNAVIRRQVTHLFAAANNDSAAVSKAPAKVEPGLSDARETNWQPSSPEEFIRGVWPHAVDAAGALGVDPLVLVAQSALETGWGKKVIQSPDGRSSHNLFGIKAGNDWEGDSNTVKTLEYRGGVAVMETAAFRAYDSLAGSFSDYANFLQSNPRYQQALEKADDSQGFLVELQQAGYATDPRYSEKIMGIVGKDTYASVINELKNKQNLPLSG